jgi:hypothetical protein
MCLVNPGNESTNTSGYFVMTDTTYDGNLGGKSGASAKCLTELTTNTNWMGYTEANAAGRLVAGKVFAFFCDSTPSGNCNNLNASTTYQFGIVGDDTIGGASFTTDGNSRGPNDSANWSGTNYFGGNYDWWANRFTSGSNWDISGTNSGTNACTSFYSNSGAHVGNYGNTAQISSSRWNATVGSCDQLRRLICYVNP